jgi:hypothetical protein
MQDEGGTVFVFDEAEEADMIRRDLLSDEETIEVKQFPEGTLPTRPFYEPNREDWDFEEEPSD